MCGIVGYYGQKEKVLDTLVSGLKRLEYRGYDSAGIAILTENKEIFACKAVGKVSQLEIEIQSTDLPDFASVGIAHTRWATHGVPSTVNAHPHVSFNEKIWLVHNGIIENYKELKEELLAEGVVFKSQTDTEIVANLVAKYYVDDLRNAVLETLARLEGTYAIAVVCTEEPNHLVAAKKGAPLVLGVGQNEYILASDVSAIIAKTRDVIYLEDDEIVDIQNGNYKITNFLNEDLDKQMERIEWNEDAASKEGYDHFLIKEIMEQPTAVRDCTRGRLLKEEGNIRFGGLIDIADRLPTIEKVVLLGIGTAHYAARLGEMYFESLAGISAKAEMSPEFRYKDTAIDENTWVIAVSQSGETADTIAAVQEAKRRGALITGIVNTVGSTLSRITDAGVYNHIGPEISVASSKAFTSQSVILLMHAILLGRMKNLGYSDGAELLNGIGSLPSLIKEVLDQNENIKAIASKYYNYPSLIYIGRKYNYPVALEGALKIKEISYIHAEGLSGGELKHGFIALVDENMPTVALVTKDSIYEKMMSNLEEIRARSGKLIVIANTGDKKVQEMAEDVIFVPKCEREELQPIVNNVALQLLAYHCSCLKNLDVDKPRNLAKSVTVE